MREASGNVPPSQFEKVVKDDECILRYNQYDKLGRMKRLVVKGQNMKSTLTVFCFVGIGISAVCGQERLPQKDAARYAKACVDQVAIDMKVSPNKAVAVLGEGGGAMVIPAKGLSAKLELGKKVTPIGQLWLRKWTLVVDGKPVPDKLLRIERPTLDDKERPMPVLLVGIRNKAGKLEMVIHSKGQKPLHVMPLKKTELIQKFPVEMEWQRGESNVDKLPLTILGKYWADVRVTRR